MRFSSVHWETKLCFLGCYNQHFWKRTTCYFLMLYLHVKGSLCTHTQVVPNLFDFLSSVEHKIRYFKECFSCFCPCNNIGPHWLSLAIFLFTYFYAHFWIWRKKHWMRVKNCKMCITNVCTQLRQIMFYPMHKLQLKHIYRIQFSMTKKTKQQNKNTHMTSLQQIMWLDNWTNQQTDLIAHHLKCYFNHFEMPELKSLIKMI